MATIIAVEWKSSNGVIRFESLDHRFWRRPLRVSSSEMSCFCTYFYSSRATWPFYSRRCCCRRPIGQCSQISDARASLLPVVFNRVPLARPLATSAGRVMELPPPIETGSLPGGRFTEMEHISNTLRLVYETTKGCTLQHCQQIMILLRRAPKLKSADQIESGDV
ncbi:hypothetical protein BJV74DRAFT_390492 [Russula compacta]|nr:hypothetical protein BJV74DRAFT_390492 [Russula compacta]